MLSSNGRPVTAELQCAREHPRFVPIVEALRENAERYSPLVVAPRALAFVA